MILGNPNSRLPCVFVRQNPKRKKEGAASKDLEGRGCVYQYRRDSAKTTHWEKSRLSPTGF